MPAHSISSELDHCGTDLFGYLEQLHTRVADSDYRRADLIRRRLCFEEVPESLSSLAKDWSITYQRVQQLIEPALNAIQGSRGYLDCRSAFLESLPINASSLLCDAPCSMTAGWFAQLVSVVSPTREFEMVRSGNQTLLVRPGTETGIVSMLKLLRRESGRRLLIPAKAAAAELERLRPAELCPSLIPRLIREAGGHWFDDWVHMPCLRYPAWAGALSRILAIRDEIGHEAAWRGIQRNAARIGSRLFNVEAKPSAECIAACVHGHLGFEADEFCIRGAEEISSETLLDLERIWANALCLDNQSVDNLISRSSAAGFGRSYARNLLSTTPVLNAIGRGEYELVGGCLQ